jgi:hypothetical protein
VLCWSYHEGCDGKHVPCVCLYSVLFGKLKLERISYRQEDNIKVDLHEIVGEDSDCFNVVSRAMNLRFRRMSGNLFAN